MNDALSNAINQQCTGELNMNRLNSVRWLCVIFGLAFIATGVLAQTQEGGAYQPTVGQPGKDVVWVPTQQDLVDRMLDLAKVTPRDFVVDLGSGDGRTVITAAKRGARSLGIEFNPDMVELSIQNAAKAGVTEKATFVKADLFESDFSKATVITMFLLPDINIKLRPKILAMKPGTRVVSNSFTMEEWEADNSINLETGCSSWCTAYLWIVPAKMAGKWKLPDGEITVNQEFQKITGALVSGGKTVQFAGKVTGDTFNFSADKVEYTGEIHGNSITLKSGNNSREALRMD
jgi:precorrin-6B methylase 2